MNYALILPLILNSHAVAFWKEIITPNKIFSFCSIQINWTWPGRFLWFPVDTWDTSGVQVNTGHSWPGDHREERQWRLSLYNTFYKSFVLVMSRYFPSAFRDLKKKIINFNKFSFLFSRKKIFMNIYYIVLWNES